MISPAISGKLTELPTVPVNASITAWVSKPCPVPGCSYEYRLDRHTCSLSDSGKELFDHVAGLPLPQCPRLTLLWLVAFAQLELGDRHRTVFAIAFGFRVAREAAAQDRQRGLDDGSVLAVALLVESRSHGVQSFGCVFNAIDQIVCVLAFKALIEGERLQAGKADQVGMLDLFRCDSVAAEEFCLNLGDLVKVKNDGQ